MNVCGQPHTPPAFPLGKMLSTNWTGGWMGQIFCLKPWRSEKSLDPARNLTSISHSSNQSTDCQPHQLHYHSYHSTVNLYWIYVIFVRNCFSTSTSHLGRNEYRSNMKMIYSKMETMPKLILTCTAQFCVLFIYKLCACHMIGCHYIQALFHSVMLHVQLILSLTSGYCHTVDETCTVVGYYTVSSGNLWPM